MQLFYNPNIVSQSKEILFDKEESKHISKVLRKHSGDHLQITNGKGELFTCELTLSTTNKCIAKIIQTESKEKRPYTIHLAVAPTKMNDRYEWFLEKATEIGIDKITPIICDHSERTSIKEERFERVLIAAMKQSLQFHKPTLNSVQTFKEFIDTNTTSQRFIAHCEETQKASFKSLIQPNKDIVILIGPEGDFSPKEIELALENDFLPVTLGSTRLRTETAAIVACHSIVLVNE